MIVFLQIPRTSRISLKRYTSQTFAKTKLYDVRTVCQTEKSKVAIRSTHKSLSDSRSVDFVLQPSKQERSIEWHVELESLALTLSPAGNGLSLAFQTEASRGGGETDMNRSGTQ